ncbi:MAG: hypothetical protein UT05_C0004G0012 [Parcubacteria group bacterium GW2011_GWF2_38_76]|nr:MAG: hypothetical protein UT05_C0004G0012 [Parcubacteria group bacterium GW2011_GWF2_38_76]HBM45684.1 hypothetical protein [Patescibacteria group bacterium]
MKKSHKKPIDKISDFLEVIKRTHTGHRDDPRVLERIKEHYHKEYVIKPEDIPESYYDNQKRLAREQGHGDIEITDETKEQLSEVIINDQNSTLDNWVNYLSSPDSDSYPMWAKYWAFNNMLKLSTFDKEKHAFGKRDKGTVAPFPDLNREALAYVVDAIVKKAGNEEIPDIENNPEFKKLLEGSNFGKLYAYAIEKVTPTEENELLNTEGRWIKYPQKSDHMPLVESLQGHGTGWCTAGESTAKIQLEGGDFYVYYSNDKQGKPTIPRVAIRMSDSKIGEVRGIAKEQNLDPYIGEVVKSKLKEFPDGAKYEKKERDMKKLTEIDKKKAKGEELTKDDLTFLYQLDSRIEGFGYGEDPRTEEITKGRKIKADLSSITGYLEEEISIGTEKEAMCEGIKFHYGGLRLYKIESINRLKFIERISGSLSLDGLESAKDLKLPKIIGRGLSLRGLRFAEGLELPEKIGEHLDLSSLKSAEGLKLPEAVGTSLDLSSLKSAEGLRLPEAVGGNLYLSNLLSAEGLKLPEAVGGSLDLRSLESAEGLELPETVGGNLNLNDLQSAEGLKLPEAVGGSLDLRSLESAEGLELPETVGGNLNLSSLESAEGLKLTETINGDIYLSSLQSAEGLKLPEAVGGNLYLSNLLSAEGLKLPKTVGGNLNLSSLQSSEGLKLPETAGGYIFLDQIPYNEGKELRKKYPNLKIV